MIIQEISQVAMCNDESRSLHRLTVEVHRRVITLTDTDKVEQISLVHIKDKGILWQRLSVVILPQKSHSPGPKGRKTVIKAVGPSEKASSAMSHPEKELLISTWQGKSYLLLQHPYLILCTRDDFLATHKMQLLKARFHFIKVHSHSLLSPRLIGPLSCLLSV